MTREEFQYLARLYVIGAIDDEERCAFEAGRRDFGPEAEELLIECRRMEAALALALAPVRPRRDARERLMNLIGNRRGAFAARLDSRTRQGKDRPLHDATESDL